MPSGNSVIMQNLQRTITIKNIGNEELTFSITHAPAPTQIYDDNTNISGTELLVSATISFSVTALKVAPGGSAFFSATVTPPKDAPPLSIFSGFIVLTSTTGSQVRLTAPPPVAPVQGSGQVLQNRALQQQIIADSGSTCQQLQETCWSHSQVPDSWCGLGCRSTGCPTPALRATTNP